MQDVGGDFENSSGRASRSTECELPGRFGRYPIHCHPPPTPDPGQEPRNFHFRLPPSLNTGQERRNFYCRLPPFLNTGREGRTFHCHPPPSPDPGWETHCHKPFDKEKGTSIRIKTLYYMHWGEFGSGVLFSFSFFTYYNTAFLLSRALQPSKLAVFLALNLEPFGYTLFTLLSGYFRGTPSYMYLVPP
jgi:hypothetical protein